MIQDNDEQIVERACEEIYDPKYANDMILQLMNQAYNALDLNEPNSDCKVVEVKFKLLFEHPVEKSENGVIREVKELVCSVGFYAYEYRDMLDGMKPGASLKFAGYKAIGLNPIVEKTKNNFTAKARDERLHIFDIRDVRFLVTKA